MASKSDQIASLFASVGFKVDNKSLSNLESSLKKVEKRLASIVKGFQSISGNKSLSGALRNTARDGGKAAASIEEVTAKLKRGIPAISVYTQQMNALASALRSVTGAMPSRLPNVPSGGGGGGGSGGVSNAAVRGGAAAGFVSSLFGGGASAFARGLMPGLGAGWAVVQSTKRAREMIATEAALGALTGSQESGKAEFEYIRNFSNTYGMVANDSAAGYKRILASSVGTALEGQGARDIFEGTSLYGKTLGLSQENMSRATTAISQMMSKGKITSEELKGQLAEAIPGAVQIFAEAMKKPVDQMFKMMENGEVLAEDVLPKVAKLLKESANSGGALAKMMKTSASEQARFVNAWDAFLKMVFESGLDQTLAIIFKTLTVTLTTLTRFAKMVKDAFGAVPSIMWKVVGVFAAFKAVAIAIPFAKMVWGFLMFQKALNPTWYKKPLLLVFLLLLLAVLEDIAYWRAGKGSLIGDLFGAWPEFVDKMEPFFKKFDAWRNTIADALKMLKDFLVTIGVLDNQTNPVSKDYKKQSLSAGAAEAWTNTPSIIRNIPIVGIPLTMGTGAMLQAIENYLAPESARSANRGVAGWSSGGGLTVVQHINTSDPKMAAEESNKRIAQLFNLGGVSPTDKR